MGIIGTIKRLLGLGEGTDRSSDDAAVTIEREPDEPATDSEAAVKRGTAGETTDGTDPVAGADGEATAETDADTATTADAAAETTETGTGAETTETDGDDASGADDATAGTADEASETAGDDVDATDTGAPGTDTTGEPADDGAASASVEEIKGIGPAYGDRLANAGIETVAQLAAADPDRVAEEAKVGPGRVERWIDRARAFEE